MQAARGTFRRMWRIVPLDQERHQSVSLAGVGWGQAPLRQDAIQAVSPRLMPPQGDVSPAANVCRLRPCSPEDSWTFPPEHDTLSRATGGHRRARTWIPSDR